MDGSGRSGEAGRQRVSFVRPKHTSIDWACPRVEEVSPFPRIPPVAVLILPHGTLFLRRLPPIPRLTHESAQREWRTYTCIRDSTRAYMWHGEGLLWRPTLGTGVKRHWPARGPRPISPARMRECVHACTCVCVYGVYVRARSLLLATVHVDLLIAPTTLFGGQNSRGKTLSMAVYNNLQSLIHLQIRN